MQHEDISACNSRTGSVSPPQPVLKQGSVLQFCKALRKACKEAHTFQEALLIRALQQTSAQHCMTACFGAGIRAADLPGRHIWSLSCFRGAPKGCTGRRSCCWAIYRISRYPPPPPASAHATCTALPLHSRIDKECCTSCPNSAPHQSLLPLQSCLCTLASALLPLHTCLCTLASAPCNPYSAPCACTCDGNQNAVTLQIVHHSGAAR